MAFIDRKKKINIEAKHFYHFEDGFIGKIHAKMEIFVELELKDKNKFCNDTYQKLFERSFCLDWAFDMDCWNGEFFQKNCFSCDCVASDRKLYKITVENVNRKFYRWENEYSSNFFRGDILFSEEKNVIRLSGASEIVYILNKIIGYFQAGFCFKKYIQKQILFDEHILLPDDFCHKFGKMFSQKGVVIHNYRDIYPCFYPQLTFEHDVR